MIRSLLCFLLGLFIFSDTLAATRLIIFPPGERALIIIQRLDLKSGVVDSDPDDLYDQLDIPERQLPSGDKGKLVDSLDQSFILTCVEKVSGLRQCQIVINHKDSKTHIDPVAKTVEYILEGPEAKLILAAFKETAPDFFDFQTSDGRTRLQITRDRVVIKSN